MTFIYDIYDTVFELIEQWLPLALVALVVLAVGIRIGLPRLIKWIERLRTRTSKEHFQRKVELLCNEDLIDLFEEEAKYVRELREGERSRKLAWLSPYERAVKAEYRRHVGKKGYTYNASKRIASVAKRIIICDAPEELLNDGWISDRYIIRIMLDGKPRSKVIALQESIAAQMTNTLIEVAKTNETRSVSFVVHTSNRIDVLTTKKIGSEFFEQYPAESPFALPLAMKANGEPWIMPLAQSVILGKSGSGKGSPIHGIVRQLVPFVNAGLVELYGIDPKRIEFKAYAKSTLFKEVVYSDEDAIEVINSLCERMLRRADELDIDLKNANLQRDFDPTVEEALCVVIIDEMVSLVNQLRRTPQGKQAFLTLENILNMGRAAGFLIVMATQDASKEVFDRLRNNLNTCIVLRQNSTYINNLLLDETAIANGFDSTAIPVSNKANGYRTSGIGYVMEDDGPVKVRFAYSDDRAIASLVLNNLKRKKSRTQAQDLQQEVAGILDDFEGLI